MGLRKKYLAVTQSCFVSVTVGRHRQGIWEVGVDRRRDCSGLQEDPRAYSNSVIWVIWGGFWKKVRDIAFDGWPVYSLVNGGAGYASTICGSVFILVQIL